jgi:hypothetical protein
MDGAGAARIAICAHDGEQIVCVGGEGETWTIARAREHRRAKPAPAKTGEEEAMHRMQLIGRDGVCVGVAEVVAAAPESEIMQTFACVAAGVRERGGLPQIAALGYGELRTIDWMTVEEAAAFAVPKKLVIEEDVFTATFNADVYDGIGLFEVVFRNFERVRLMKVDRIAADRVFAFLAKVMALYSKSVYTWKHAVDVVQYLAWELTAAKLEKSYIS